MSQNRNKLIDWFIGNIANAALHRILESAIDDQVIASRYEKEINTSFNIAKSYREKINPVKSSLPSEEIFIIRKKVIARVNSELATRVANGYKNIDFSLVEPCVDLILKEMKIS